MWSRYDFMTESNTLDIDDVAYPDPLSINYMDTMFTSVPTKIEIGQGDINKFWLTMYKNYKIVDHDDVLLGLNGIPYIGMLEPGDVIYKLALNDVENFATQKRIK